MKNNKGFTLLEIIVVVFILSLLAAIVAPKIIGRTDDARITEAKVQIKNFETALKLFKLDNGFYPSTEQGLVALVERPGRRISRAEESPARSVGESLCIYFPGSLRRFRSPVLRRRRKRRRRGKGCGHQELGYTVTVASLFLNS